MLIKSLFETTVFSDTLILFTEIEFSFKDLLASPIDFKKLVSFANKKSIFIPLASSLEPIDELGTPSKISLKVFSSNDSKSSLLYLPKRTFDALTAFFKSSSLWTIDVIESASLFWRSLFDLSFWCSSIKSSTFCLLRKVKKVS